jgi:probable HAF family extracellular repeat protein
VALDASASTDREGPIAAYSWNFGDGSAVATGVTTSHTYSTAGSFSVTLTVTDNNGATGAANRTITVTTNAPPVAAFTATPASGLTPLTVALDASSSSDPDGSIAGYEWTFGDGATGTGPTTQHIYVNAGSFQVTLKVTDDRGAVSTASKSITVVSGTAAAWYSVTEIPSLGGSSVEPSSVNNRMGMAMGMATGYSYFDATDVAHAFAFNGRTSLDIGTLGGKTSYGRDVNDYADIVGNSDNAQGFSHAFGFIYLTMRDLGTLGGFTSEATGINNMGQIVGRSDDKDGFVRAFLYENGQMRSLGTLGGDWSQASAINENGVVAGTSKDAKGEIHAFTYSCGVMTDVSGVAVLSVSGINDSNDVIGMWLPPQGYSGYTGFLYRGGVMQPLVPGYSEPLGINNSGIVVGYAHFGQDGHAFVWDKTKGLQDLNSLIDPSLGWTLQVAEGINDMGQIVAHGYRAGGASVAVLLTPAAKPSP